MKLDRIDFVDNDSCFFCNHKLATKIAYIFIMEDGTEIQSGPECAKKHSIVKDVPNLTKGSLEKKQGAETTESRKKSNLEVFNEKYTKEVEYLILRCDRLSDFYDIDYEPLMKIYDKYIQNSLDQNDYIYLKNIVNKADREYSKYGYKNLMACYAAKHHINLWIKNEFDNTFAQGIYDYLRKNYFLTEKQIVAANNWIRNVSKVSQIEGKWFYKK